MAATPESKVKRAVKAVLKQHGIWYFMPVQNGMGRIGIPDFICCARGRFLAIEAKAPGKAGTLTPNQVCIREEILTHGGLHFVIDDASILDKFLRSLSHVA